VALKAIRAYRTVSDEVAIFLAGKPPVDLLASERMRIKARATGDQPEGPLLTLARIKLTEHKTTFLEWQRRWRLTAKAPFANIIQLN